MQLSFKQFIENFDEAITNMMFHGQWGPKAKKKYGYDKKDLGILENPNATEKIMRKWDNSKQNFEVYFARSAEARKHVEVGQKSLEWVKENLGFEITPQPDTISIIFTQNTGTEKIPMTAWAIAHRLGHAIRRENIFEEYFYKQIVRDFKDLLQNAYNLKFNPNRYGTFLEPNDEKILKKFAYEIGTMKSVRERKLVSFYEFVYELVAQYIVTGNIKFNPLPKKFITKNKMTYGRPDHTYAHAKLNEDEYNEYNEQLQGFAEVYEYNLDSVFGSLLNKIFVM